MAIEKLARGGRTLAFPGTMNRRIRMLGWMGSVAIVASVMLPSAALAASVTPTFTTGNVPASACSGAQHVVSIDPSGIRTSGSFTYLSSDSAVSIRVTYHGGSQFPYASNTSFDFAVIQGSGLAVVVSEVFVESANQFQTVAWTGHNTYDYSQMPAANDTSLAGPTQAGSTDPTASVIDLVVFCADIVAAPTPSAAPTSTAAPTPSAAPTSTAAPTPSAVTTSTAAPTSTAATTSTAAPTSIATPSGAGSVAAGNGGASIPTAPPTDSLDSRSPGDPGLALIVVAMALVTLSVVLFVTPARRRR